jgi:hypothetical protein
VIAREKQREQLGGGAITEGETRAKNASGNGPLKVMSDDIGKQLCCIRVVSCIL